MAISANRLPAHLPFFPLSVWLCWLAALCVYGVGVSARSDLDLMLQLAQERYGEPAVGLVKSWRNMLDDAQELPDQEKLRRVNEFVNNRVSFETDMVVWHQEDYWATPLEFFGKRAGDCEDFAIAKYMSLRLLGIPAQKLRLVYVRARLGAQDSQLVQAHMVLSYYETPASTPLILDNLIGEIRPADRRPDLFPVFSFNSEGLWIKGDTASSADPTARLSRWRGVLERMRREGLDLS